MHELMNMPIEIIKSTKEESNWIENQIDVFNREQLSFSKINELEHSLNYVVKEKEKERIVAGINCCFYLNEILYVGVLFVEEALRHGGIGTKLLQNVEQEAKHLGAKLAHLDTFDFQAKDFYLKHGYEIFGVLDDCPAGHKRYYLKKKL